MIEVSEWSENLKEEYADTGLSTDLARHIVRSVPYRVRHDVESFDGTPPNDESLGKILPELRFSIVAICDAVFEDAALEDILLDNSVVETVLKDVNALIYGEDEFHDDVVADSVFSSAFRLEDSPLFQVSPLENDTTLPPKLSGLNSAVRTFVEALENQQAFSFWRDWYRGFLNGKPLDWELQRRVALIPDEDWEKGPTHIAEKIEEIKAAYLAEKIPQAETVEFDEAESRFFTIPVPVAKPDLLGATLSQLEDALDDALANPSNGLSERSRETRALRRTVSKYGNDPQRIEMDLTSVHAGLTRQLVNGELPTSEENLALQSACGEGARGIRATHARIAENRRILTEQAIRELSRDETAVLEEALPVLKAISRDDLAEEWAQDIPALINDSLLPVPKGAGRLPGADEATRIFSRAAKISIWLRMGKVISAVDGSTGYKGARIVTTIGALVGIGLKILGVF